MSQYDRMWDSSVSRATGRAISAVLEEHGCTQVVELGCGTGIVTQTLCNAGFHVCAIDKSPEAVKRATKRCKEASIRCCDASEILPRKGVALVAANVVQVSDDATALIRQIIVHVVHSESVAVIAVPGDKVSMRSLFRFERKHGETLSHSLLALMLRVIFGLSSPLFGVTRSSEQQIATAFAKICKEEGVRFSQFPIENGEVLFVVNANSRKEKNGLSPFRYYPTKSIRTSV